MACGLSYIETLDLPLGHLMTIINYKSIANGAKQGKTRSEEEDFWAALSRK